MVIHVIATPIGNIKDITYRAVETLKKSDIILCEDTRCALKLFNYYGIRKRVISYHKFNEYKLIDRIVDEIKNGVNYAIVSDAGMPGICDPGKDLINRCIEENIKVDVLPGACALINGFVLSGFNNNIFTFIGFLPIDNVKLREIVKIMKNINSIFVIYESPHRILNTLEFLKKEFGENVKLYIGRELTKLFEENFRGTLKEAIEYFKDRKIRGEFVICMEKEIDYIEHLDDEFVLNEFLNNRDRFNLTTKENIKKICNDNNLKKNYVYNLIIKKFN